MGVFWVTRELIIAGNDLTALSYLRRGAPAAESEGRVVIRDGSGRVSGCVCSAGPIDDDQQQHRGRCPVAVAGVVVDDAEQSVVGAARAVAAALVEAGQVRPHRLPVAATAEVMVRTNPLGGSTSGPERGI